MPRRIFATAVLMMFGAPAVFVPSGVPRKRSVEMEIILPNGAAPRVAVPEAEGAIVRLPDRSGFGFVPTIREGDDPLTVVVAIWDVDAKPNRRLGHVEVVVGAPAVKSDTSPSFGIRVLRVISKK